MTAIAKAERLARLVGTLAALAAALTLVVITVSALLRLTQAVLGCEPWPQCYGVPLAAWWLDAVRTTHRLAAMAVASVVLLTLVLAASGGRAALRLSMLAGAALTVVALLTWVGIITPGARVPAVALANLVGGMLLFALLWGLHLEANGVRTQPTRASSVVPVLIALPLLLLQIALGALAHATYGSAGCPSLAGCAAAQWLPHLSATAFDPLRPVAGVAGHNLPHADAVAVHITHRLMALVVTAALLVVAWQGWRDPVARASAIMLLAALVLQVATGALLLLLGFPLAAVAAHNVAASLLLASLVLVAFRLRVVP